MSSLTGPVLVTGTDTGVGKTIVTAAIAACATASGLRVAVFKPGQTGVDPGYGEVPDEQVVARLARPATTRTLAEYPDPLAPLAAARIARMRPLTFSTVVEAVGQAAADHDLVLIEGAGGLLVPMGTGLPDPPDGDGEDRGALLPRGAWTVADLAANLGAPAVVVARAGLGTLNHTALTLAALKRRAVPSVVVVGAWPGEPELVHLANLDDLPGDLHGLLPEGAGAMEPGVFRRSAPGWLTETLYGSCDDPRSWAEIDY
jgi:dethiobiotin synthetase